MHLFGLSGDSPFDSFVSFLEKVFLLQEAVQGQQSIHGLVVGFQFVIGKDVNNMQ